MQHQTAKNLHPLYGKGVHLYRNHQHFSTCVDEKDAGEKATLLCGFFAYFTTKQAKIMKKSQVSQK